MDPGSSLLFPPQFLIRTSLLLAAPVPHYLSPLSHHCCDYGCHAAVKRFTINRPEIKPKNEFPRPHALLSRNYLAGWLVHGEDGSGNQKHWTGRGRAWTTEHATRRRKISMIKSSLSQFTLKYYNASSDRLFNYWSWSLFASIRVFLMTYFERK